MYRMNVYSCLLYRLPSEDVAQIKCRSYHLKRSGLKYKDDLIKKNPSIYATSGRFGEAR